MTDTISTYPRTVVSQLVTETNELTSYVIQLLTVVNQDTDRILAEIKATTEKLDEAAEELVEVKESTLGTINSALSDMNDIYLDFQNDSKKIMEGLNKVQSDVVQLDKDVDALGAKTVIIDAGIANLDGLYKGLSGTADSIDLRIRLLQSSTTSLESRASTLQTQLNSMSADVQKNKGDLSAMNNILQSMLADVSILSDIVSDNSAAVTELNATVASLSSTATQALDIAKSARDTATVVQQRLDVAQEDLNDVEARVASNESSITGHTAKLQSIASDITKAVSDINTLNGKITQESTRLNDSIAAVDAKVIAVGAKVSPLESKVADLEARAVSLDIRFAELNTTVSNAILDSTQATKDAIAAANALTSQSTELSNKQLQLMGDLTGVQANIGEMNNDILLFRADITALKDDVVSTFYTMRGEATTLNAETEILHSHVVQMHGEVEADTAHVDAQVAYVDQKVVEVDTLYLRKTGTAADSSLLGGKNLEYMLHDGNMDAKVNTAAPIVAIKADITAIQNLLISDTSALDTLQEIVDFIEANKATLDNLTISNIAGLQTALDNKLGLTATAAAATKLATARTINGTSFDGSANITTANWGTSRTLTVGNTGKSVSGSGNVSWTLAEIGAVPLTRKVNNKALSADISLIHSDVGAFSSAEDVTLAAGKKVTLATPSGAPTPFTFENVMLNDGSVVETLKNNGTSVGTHITKVSPAGIVDFGIGITIGGAAPFTPSNVPDWSVIPNKPATATRWPAFNEVTSAPATATRWPTYDEVTGKPTTFTPSAHSHSWDETTGKPTTFTPSAHNHYNLISQEAVNKLTGTADPAYPGISLAKKGTGYNSAAGAVVYAASGTHSFELDFDHAASPALRLRSKVATSGSWGNNVLLMSDANIGSYAPSLTGTGASGTWGIGISGNAATASTATKLTTARTINGVNFDGTANITVEDNTKLPLSGGTVTGSVNLTAPLQWGNKAVIEYGKTFIPSGYLDSGEYFEIATISPGGASRNYVVRGTFVGQSGGSFGSWDFTWSVRSGTLPTIFQRLFVNEHDTDLSATLKFCTWIDQATGVCKLVVKNDSAPGTFLYNGAVKFTVFCRDPASATNGDLSLGATGEMVKPVEFTEYPALRQSINLHTGNIQTYSPSLTGAGASGTWSIGISGNAATATKLATARTINGVGFDGSANITVSDDTKLPLSGGTITGDLIFTKSHGKVKFVSSTQDSRTGFEFIDGSGQNLLVEHIVADGSLPVGAGGQALVFTGTAAVNHLVTDGDFYARGDKKVYHTGNIPTASEVGAPSLTGVGASGSWGISVTGSAATLTTARTIALSGAATGTATSFNGSANITIPVTSLNAANLSGTVPNASISGTYTGLTNLTGSGTVDFSKFHGNAGDTVSAPSFAWTGDTNTGIYSPGADQLAITTGGVQRLLANSSGITATTFIGALNGNANTATKLATARTINGVGFDGSANITIPAGTHSHTPSELGVPNMHSPSVSLGDNSVVTTDDFIDKLKTLGALTTDSYWICRGSWHYAGQMRVDTGVGVMGTAGAVIEVFGNSAQYTVRVSTPTTGSGSDFNRTYTYVFNGTTYAPGWRAEYNTNYKPTAADVGAPSLTGVGASGSWGISVTGSAATLATARTIALSGAATGTATSFNGSANITIPVTSLNAANLSGTVPNASISGTYTGLTNLTGSGTVDFSKFHGNAGDTVSAPSFSWTGDTNTGIYSPGADQLALTTGGVQRLLANSSGITATTFIGALTGNASTATKLATARTINGVSFDGSANITVPAGSHSHTAADVGALAAGATAVAATKLATARTINGVSFDGTANISLPVAGHSHTATEVGALPSTGGTLSGNSASGYMGLNIENAASGWSYMQLRAANGAGVAHIAVNPSAADGGAANSLHLRPNGVSTGSLILQPNAAMKHQTSSGAITIGCGNTTYCHYNTDRPSHWFNTDLRVDGEIYAGSGYSQRVYHAGNKPTATDVGALPVGSSILIGNDSAVAYGRQGFQVSNFSGSGGTGGNGSSLINPTGDWYHHATFNHSNPGGYYIDLAMCFHEDYYAFRRVSNGTNHGFTRIYTDRFKPTPADIGAVPSSGDGSVSGVFSAGRIASGYDSGVAGSLSCSNWFRSSGNTGWFNATYSGGITMEDATWVRVYNSKAFLVSNQIAATGNITAYYSDGRLKDVIDDIDPSSALSNVCSWRKIRYTANQLANDLGDYDMSRVDIGLVTQDIEKDYPEVVHLAPFDIATSEDGVISSKSGENYRTMDYGRTAPILAAAITALKEENDSLKREIAEIKALLNKLY